MSVFRRLAIAFPLITVLFTSTSAIAQDPIGSYAGASVQFEDIDSDVPVAVEGSYSITDNVQIRASLGDGLAAAAVTASVSTGQWRFAAGPGLRYTEKIDTIEFQEFSVNPLTGDSTPIGEPKPIEIEDNGTDVVGLLVAERALGEYGVIFGSVSFSESTSGSIGAGLRF